MRTSRTALAIIAAAGLLITACGDPDSAANAKDLPKIRVGSAAAGPASASAPAAESGGRGMDSKMMAAFYTYTFAGAWPKLPAKATVYRLDTSSIDKARVGELAAVLGVAGDPVKLPADQGGGWRVGAEDGSTASLWVNGGMGDWSYNGMPSSTSSGCGVAEPATTVVPPIAPDSATVDPAPPADGSANDTVGAPAPTDQVTPICDQPVYPDTATLVAATNALLSKAKLGVWQLDTSGASYGSIAGYQSIGGARAPYQLNVSFSPEGEISWASGTMSTPVAVGDYPLLPAKEALDRFNKRSIAQFNEVKVLGPADEVIEPAVAVGEPATDGAATPDMSIAIEPMPPMELMESSVDTVKLGLTSLWDVDGAVWLVPSYEFSNTDGMMISVDALPDEYLDQQQPPETTLPPETAASAPDQPSSNPDTPVTTIAEPTPTPTITETPSTVPQALQQVVGLAEDEATKVITQYGWTARVVSIDGVGQAVTMDLRSDRLNLDIVNGLVTAVSVG